METGRKHCRTWEITLRVRFKRSHQRLSITPFEIRNVMCKHVWNPKVDAFSTCCDGHVVNMKQGTCISNFMLLNVLVGKLYQHFQAWKLVEHPVYRLLGFHFIHANKSSDRRSKTSSVRCCHYTESSVNTHSSCHNFSVSVDEVWIGDWIYWKLMHTAHYYKQL
jgi:hypothetical protein